MKNMEKKIIKSNIKTNGKYTHTRHERVNIFSQRSDAMCDVMILCCLIAPTLTNTQTHV